MSLDNAAGRGASANWLNNYFREKRPFDQPNKFVFLSDIDLVFGTPKKLSAVMEEKAMLDTLERLGVIETPLWQLLMVKQLAFKLDAAAIMIVYKDGPLNYRPGPDEMIYTLNLKTCGYLPKGDRGARITKDKFYHDKLADFVVARNMELRSVEYRRIESETKHRGHLVLCGNCGDVLYFKYPSDALVSFKEQQALLKNMPAGMGMCNCFVSEPWCETCQEFIHDD